MQGSAWKKDVDWEVGFLASRRPGEKEGATGGNGKEKRGNKKRGKMRKGVGETDRVENFLPEGKTKKKSPPYFSRQPRGITRGG